MKQGSLIYAKATKLAHFLEAHPLPRLFFWLAMVTAAIFTIALGVQSLF
ncbi:MAG: hypothetical protein R8J94_21720 [Acidimicrobiia bacterium]|nr:hypothetical protein [Acidimicrobiia bacterium]